MNVALLTVVGIVAVALLFGYTNGFHDSANSGSTIVATRVLRPRWAVLWAAFFNFIAFVFFGTKVANTIGQTVKTAVVSVAVIFAAVLGATLWNYATWWLRLPTSSSHALIGGLVGAGLAKGGLAAHTAIALGTVSGGWRIVQTMGRRITELRPARGMAAETGAAVALFGSTALGAPVSTTHTVAGAVTGVGTVTPDAPVNWTVFGQMTLAWVVTIPAAALAAAGIFGVTQLPSHLLAGTVLVVFGVVAAAVLGVALRRTMRSRHFEPGRLADDRSAVPAG